MAFLSDLLDGEHLNKLDSRERQDNLAWVRAQTLQPAPGDPPAAPARTPTPEQADDWWGMFLSSTGADVANVLTRGLSLGIISGKNLPVLGSIIEKYQTPEERKTAVQKVGEFAGELLAGAVTAGPLLGPIGRAAAGLVPKAGKVVAGAVRAGAEGAALGAAQAGTAALRGEETPMGALEKVAGGAVLGGLFGGAIGKVQSVMAARAKRQSLGQLQAALAKARTAKDAEETAKIQDLIAESESSAATEAKAVSEYEDAVLQWAKGLDQETVKPAQRGAVSLEAEATSATPAPPGAQADPRALLQAADRLESSKLGLGARGKAALDERIGELRQQAMAAQAGDAATEAAAEVTARKEWPAWRQALIKGGMTGNIEQGFSTILAQGLLGALVGAPVGAATAETPEDRLRNAIIGAAAGAVLAPALLSRVTKLLGPKVAELEATAAKAGTVTAPVPEGVTPPPTRTRIRIEEVDTPAAEKLLTDLEGKTQEAGGFVFHVPCAERATRADLAQSVQALTRTLESRVGAARIGKVSDEVLNSVASSLDLGDLLAKKVGAGWNRFEAAAIGMHLRAADADFWRLLQTARDNPEALNEFKRVSGVLLSLTRTMFGAVSEWGYTGHVWQQVQEATPAARNSVRLIAQLLGMDGAEAQLKLGVTPARWHEMMLALAEQHGKTQQLVGFGTLVKQINAGLMEAWINGLLSGPITHAANVLGNIGPVFAGPAERYLASKFSTQAVGSVVPGEASEMLYGLWGGMHDAFKAASRAFRSGESAWDALATKVETPVRQAIAAEQFGLDTEGVLGRAVDLLGTVVRTPGRALTAADDFFKMLNYRMELHALTYRAARLAHPEGGRAFTDSLAAIRADPTQEILEQASRFAEVQTFTAPLGDFGNALQRLSNSHPAVKLVLPFVRTPSNLVKYAWERAPGLNLLSGQVRADLMQPGAARELALAKMSLGGMVAGTAAVLAAAGYLTGSGPTDKTLRQNLEQTGWQPYSLKLGDTYYAFSRLDPIGMTLGAIADWADLSGHLAEPDAMGVAQALVLSMLRNVTSKTWVQGVSNALEAVTDQDGKYLKTFFTLQARSLVPSFVAQANRSFVDPELHEVRGILDAMKSRIPGFSATLPPRRNLFGEPVLLEGGIGPDIASPIYTRTATGDPVAEEIAANRMRVALPPAYVYGTRPPETLTAEQRVAQGVALTPQEHDRFILLAGREVRNADGQSLRDALARLVASPEYQAGTTGPDGMRATMVHRVVDWYQGEARRRLLDESPELSLKVADKQQARIAARSGMPAISIR